MSRRIAEFPIGGTIFKGLWQTGSVHEKCRVDNGVPEDAKLVGVRYDTWTDRVIFLFESDSFDEVIEGNFPPEVNITVSVIKREMALTE